MLYQLAEIRVSAADTRGNAEGELEELVEGPVVAQT